MGLMRFVADQKELLTEERIARAYITGPDETPTFGRTLLSGDQVVIERVEDASGSFNIPWPVPGRGDWLLSTSSLMEREKPYQLEVELSRGIVFRLRDQLAVWEMLGLKPTEEILKGVSDSTRALSRAAVNQAVDPATAAVRARTAIQVAAETSCLLADAYSEQALALRMGDGQRLTTLLGVRLGDSAPRGVKARDLAASFNMASVPCGWGAVEPSEGRREWTGVDKPLEWAATSGMRVCIGPLIEFDDRLLPDWAYLWEGDVEALTSLMLSHVRQTVQRYRGKAQLWHVASKINRDRVLSLTDEQRLQLVAGAVRAVRQIDPSTPIVVGFEQPWGEYRATRQSDLGPIDFADALERADLGIAGFELELNFGYRPFGSELRNPLSLSRLIDLWNVRLESPLMLSIAVPSSAEEDPASDSRLAVVAASEEEGLLTPDFQSEWARQNLPLLMAKNAVQVLVWSQLTDHGPHTFPNAGLYDATKTLKPVLGELSELRKTLLA